MCDKNDGLTSPHEAAWRRSVARVNLHPAWPVLIDLDVVRAGHSVHLAGGAARKDVVLNTLELRCIVHAYDASYVITSDPPLVPMSDLPMMDIMFSRRILDIDASGEPVSAATRLRHVLDLIRASMLHELDEFLLVDGHVATSPHGTLRTTLEHVPSMRHAGTSTWEDAIARVSLHRAFGIQVDLGVVEDLQGSATISCTVRNYSPGLAYRSATICRVLTAQANDDRVQRLLTIVRGAAMRLLDDCLIIDKGKAIDGGDDAVTFERRALEIITSSKA